MKQKIIFRGLSLIYGFIFAGLLLFIILTGLQFKGRDRIVSWGGAYQTTWYQVMEDGSKVKLSDTRKIEPQNGGKVVICTTLPKSLPNDTIFSCFTGRDSLYYVGEQMRESLFAYENPMGGKTVKGIFVQIPLSEEDSGKELRIVRKGIKSSDSILSWVFLGNSYGVFKYVLSYNGPQCILAFFLLLMSLIIIIIGIVTMGRGSRGAGLLSFGLSFLSLSVWLILDSPLIQYTFNIYFIDGIWEYLVSMVMMAPFMFFLNIQQKGRYVKLYECFGVVLLVDFFALTILHFCDIYSFQETRPFMNGLIGVLIAGIVGTIVRDIINGSAKDYVYIVIGCIMLGIGGISEVILINTVDRRLDGLNVLIGLYILFGLTVVQIVKQYNEDTIAAREAIRANTMKSQFLANMSHEIRTPINAIMGMDEMILREECDEDILEYASNIKKASDSLLSIVNDILDFSKIESGKIELIEDAFKLHKVLSEVESMVSVKATDKELEFNYFVDPTLYDNLYGDENKLRQILVNLLNNAVKYTEVGGINVRILREDKEGKFFLRADIQDSGIGIKKEDMTKLFQKFSRLDEKRNKSIEGTGLGLAITSQFVDLMGGSISVDSEYNVGTCFTVLIPFLPQNDELIENYKKRVDDYKKFIEEQKKSKGKFIAPDAKVLIVDDNRMNLSVACGLLKRTRIQVDTCISGEKMHEKIKENQYDVIFVDHMMPQMDGIEALNIARHMPENKNQKTPYIVMTANAIKGAREVYLEKGFDDYLDKPIVADRLEEMLMNYLPKSKIRPYEPAKQKPGKKNQPDKLNKTGDIEQEVGLKYCAGDMDFYREMLNIFSDVANEKMEELTKAFENKDLDNYRIIIHSVKNNAQNIGASTLAKKALNLENAAKEQNINYIKEHHQEVMAFYTEVANQAKQMQ